VTTPATNAWAPFPQPPRDSGRERQEATPRPAGNTGNARCENPIVTTRIPVPASDNSRSQRVEAHLDLVPGIARAYRSYARGHGIELEDLVAYGRRGLLDAASRFDTTNGAPFGAFARPRIHGAIIDGIRREGWFGRRAHHRRTAGRIGDSAKSDRGRGVVLPSGPSILYASPGTGAGGEDWLAEIASTGEAGQTMRWNGRRMVQLPVEDEGALQALAAANLFLLPSGQRRLLELRYFHGKTLSQAASEMGFRRSWASRLHARALATLGAAMRAHFPYRRKGANGNERPSSSRQRTRSATR